MVLEPPVLVLPLEATAELPLPVEPLLLVPPLVLPVAVPLVLPVEVALELPVEVPLELPVELPPSTAARQKPLPPHSWPGGQAISFEQGKTIPASSPGTVREQPASAAARPRQMERVTM
jgi:hypothetical protein